MSESILDELKKCSRLFEDANPGLRLVHMQLPTDLFDRLLGELELIRIFRSEHCLNAFTADAINIGTLHITRQKAHTCCHDPSSGHSPYEDCNRR